MERAIRMALSPSVNESKPPLQSSEKILISQISHDLQISLKMFRSLGLAGAVMLLSSLNLVSATCYGPNTCLEGYVWRQANPTDYVCVIPSVRQQAADDNAAAASRINPNGGPYGPNTCLNGYVWREAFTDDEVCVLPATRTEAADDNAAAADRVLSMNIWTTDWYPGPNTYPFYKINGDQFNYGSVQVAIFDNNNNVIQPWTTVTAAAQSGYVAGAWGVEFTVNDCSENPPPFVATAYAWAQDMTSGCYSEKLPIDFCYTL
jgi:hypothetical protein